MAKGDRKRKQAQDNITRLEHAIRVISRRMDDSREELARLNRERAQHIEQHQQTIARLRREHGLIDEAALRESKRETPEQTAARDAEFPHA